jgi:ubiquinone/menaquinone biosynthesis C-methylase UbiE
MEINMEFTGERMIPGKVDSALLMEHLARYRFATKYSGERKVLDAACGAGYGTYMLSKNASEVAGMDRSAEAINYASENYRAGNVKFVTGDVTSMPFDSDSFDLITAFEIFEHVENPQKMLKEMSRVLREDGIILISTPNAEYEKSTVKNEFHVKEYNLEEFQEILKNEFKGVIEIIAQRSTSSSSGLKRLIIKIKRMLGIGPLLGKPVHTVSSPDELLSINPPYKFENEDLKNAETFIAMIRPGK